PSVADIERFTASTRPEVQQAEAQLRAARADADVARGARLPALAYSADQGFDSPSLHAGDIRQHRGYLVTANVNVPLFDWGSARARQRQGGAWAPASRTAHAR